MPDARRRVLASRWYQLTFFVPAHWQGKERRTYIHFEKAVFYAKAYLNSTLLGEHYGQRDPFEFEISNTINYGKQNKLLVFVHNESEPFYHPYVGYRGRAWESMKNYAIATVMLQNCLISLA